MRPFEGSFSASGASKVDPCLADWTINTYGFNLRQGQLDRPALDWNAMFFEVRNRAFDGSLPLKAKIAIAGLHRQSGNLRRLDAGPVHIELLVVKTIGPSRWSLDE